MLAIVEINEVVGLGLVLIFCIVALVLRPALAHRGGLPLVLAFLFTVAARLFTVVEDLMLYELFNQLEHACGAAAAICLAIYCVRLVRDDAQQDAPA